MILGIIYFFIVIVRNNMGFEIIVIFDGIFVDIDSFIIGVVYNIK